jgi:outer membrane protein
MLPQVTASAGYLRRTTNAIPGSFSSPSPDSWSDQIGLQQLIWDFGATPRKWQAARANAEAAESNQRAQILGIELSVRQAFLSARTDRALTQVADETLQNLLKHLDQIQGFVKAGTRPEIDLVQARTDAANARVQLINAQNAFETAKVQLNQTMGVVGPTDYDLADEPPRGVPGEDAETDPMVAEAEKARPEIASLEQQIHAQQFTIKSVDGQYLPALFGNLGFTQGGSSLDHLGWNASAGVTLSWQLFQGGLTRGQAQEAEANLAGLIAQLDGLRQQLRVDVDTARLSVRAGKTATSASQDVLLNARERLRLAEQRYQVGVGSSIELGDAQVAVTQAAAQAVQADAQLALARAQLLHALGRRSVQ